jgi:hypothetical protein
MASSSYKTTYAGAENGNLRDGSESGQQYAVEFPGGSAGADDKDPISKLTRRQDGLRDPTLDDRQSSRHGFSGCQYFLVYII